jgi:N-dimethylarginine dimethylaminohydrolase
MTIRFQTMPETRFNGHSFNGHSMVDRLVRVLVCSPRAAGWDQPSRLARWQELGFLHPPDFQKAQTQHDVLCRELRAAGAEVVELPPNQQATLDAVFAHDATLPTDFGLIVMRPGKANRETEGRYQSLCRARLQIPTLGEIVEPGTC